MFHGDLYLRAHALTDVTINRRASERLGTRGEIVIAWDHDLSQRWRFRLVDLAEGGVRIAGSFPIVKGMRGIAISYFPEGERINKPIEVRWVDGPNEGGGYEAGIAFLD